jgi:transmembrane sensor
MLSNEHIDALIAAYLSGQATPEQAMELNDWRTADKNNETYFNECENAFYLVNPSEKFNSPNHTQAWEKIQQQISSESKIIPLQKNRVQSWRIAASITLIIGLSLVLFHYFKTDDNSGQQFLADKGVKKIQLTEKTDITLQPNAQLSTSANFGKTNRLVKLKGDAYFSVTHQNELPFTVDVGKVFIKDIGTKFNVRFSSDTDTVFVNVDEGLVLLFDSLGAELEIKASEKALYIKSKKQIISSSDVEVQNKTQTLAFNNESLQNVAALLSKRYNVSITLGNAAISACKITTRFQNEDIETVLAIICETLKISYLKTGNGYILNGNSCGS